MLNKLYRRTGTRQVLVQAEPAGKFLEADCDAGLASAHTLEQGGLLGIGGRLLPLAWEQVTHPRGRLIQRFCHGGSIPQGGHNPAPAAGQGLLLKPYSGRSATVMITSDFPSKSSGDSSSRRP
jgi:hypothetical protein